MAISQNSAYIFSSRAIQLVIATLSTIIVPKILEPDAYGVFMTLILANVILGNLSHVSIPTSNKYFIGKDRSRLAAFHTNSIIAIVIVCGMMYLILAFFQAPLRHLLLRDISVRNLIIVVSLLPLTLYYLVFVGIMTGLEEIKKLALFNLFYLCAPPLTFIIIAVLLSPTRDHVLMVNTLIIAWACISFAAIPVMLLVLRRQGSIWNKPDSSIIRQIFSFGSKAHFGALAGVTFNRMDFFMIRAMFEGSATFGVYQIARSWSEKVFRVSSAMDTSAFRSVAAGETDDIIRLVPKLVRTTLYVAAAFGMIIVIGGPLLMRFVLTKYLAALVPLLILIAGNVFMCGSRMFAMYFTGHLGKPQIPSTIAWITLLYNIPLVYFLTRHYGIIGTASGIAGSYIIMFIIYFVLFRFKVRSIPLKEFFVLKKEDINVFRRTASELLSSLKNLLKRKA